MGSRSLVSWSWARALPSLVESRALLGSASPPNDFSLNKDSASDLWIFL